MRDCRPFPTQCELHFELQANLYPTDRSKITYIILHLTGRAETWATAEWSRLSAVCSSYQAFLPTFTQIFQQVSPGRVVAREIINIRQGKKSLRLCYRIDRQWLELSRPVWCLSPWFITSYQGSADCIRWTRFIDRSYIRIDKRLQEHKWEHPRWRSTDQSHVPIWASFPGKTRDFKSSRGTLAIRMNLSKTWGGTATAQRWIVFLLR